MRYALARKGVRLYPHSVPWWENLRNIRKAKHLTGADFGVLIGESPQRVSDWENGRNPHPRLDTLERIADALGVTVGELVAENVDPVRHNKEIQEQAESAGATSGPNVRPTEETSAGTVVAASPRILNNEELSDIIELAAAAADIKNYFDDLILSDADERARREDAMVGHRASAHGAGVHRFDRKTPGKGRRKV
jgi:transcriptional regulator with XRE-family HTH domain